MVKLCVHNRRTRDCVACDGAGVCEHKHRRRTCARCNGSYICIHGSLKNRCKLCHRWACDVLGCPINGIRLSGVDTLAKHTKTYHTGRVKTSNKLKELDLYRAITAAGYVCDYQLFMPFDGCGIIGRRKYAYLDFVIPKPWGYVILECDEHAHSLYPPGDDVERDFNTAHSISLGSGHKVRIVRFNPDAFKVDGVTRRTTKQERHTRLLEVLEWGEPERYFERVFLFYNHSTGDTLPEVAKDWDCVAKAVSRML